MAKVVCRLPVIEGLVAVLDRCIDCRKYVGSQKDVESADWFYCEGGCWSIRELISSSAASSMYVLRYALQWNWTTHFILGRGAALEVPAPRDGVTLTDFGGISGNLASLLSGSRRVGSADVR